MSFFQELARRNVVKVAGLYVVAAWLLLQVADVLTDMLPVPEWTGTLVFLLLLLGISNTDWIHFSTRLSSVMRSLLGRSQTT